MTVGKSNHSYTLVYDGNCKICGRLVELIKRWDSSHIIQTLPYQDESVGTRFPWISAEAYSRAMQLVDDHGETWEGAEAVEQLLKILPRGKLLGWVFKLPLGGWLADSFYRWFARNRYRLGCGQHCRM